MLLNLYVLRNFGGTGLSVEMLKGYMVRERLGTSGLVYVWLCETKSYKDGKLTISPGFPLSRCRHRFQALYPTV